jgi:hypothetical protein
MYTVRRALLTCRNFQLADEPLSSAMLSGRANDYFGDSPTPNEFSLNDNMDFSDEGSKMELEEGGSMSKMTDEEKRKNFLERNRYVLQSLIVLY